MKKLTIIPLLACIAAIACLCSCSKETTQPSAIGATYRGAAHSFNSANGMLVYQSSGISSISAEEPGTNSNISMNIRGTDIGTYPVSPTSTSGISMMIGPITYSSASFISHGSIILTKLDPNTMRATGTFTGTLYNNNTQSDSVVLTLGTIAVKYQF